MNTFKHTVTLALAMITFNFSTSLGQQATTATMIKLGQPAPPFKASYWLRGKPLTKFETGQVYVLEFYATWCHYCIQAMPHLSELNTQYAGKVRFIGVDVQEATPWGQDPIEFSRKHVDDFYKTGMGKVMNYDLCRDTKDGFMTKYWVTAQGLYGYGGTGIPFTVIIDQNGNAAWVGHPYVDGAMEKALAEIVTGKFDQTAFIADCDHKIAAIKKAETDRQARLKLSLADPSLAGMNKALDEKKYADAITAAYLAIGQNPKLYSPTFSVRLNAFKELSVNDPGKSIELLQKLESEQIIMRKDTVHMFLKDVASAYGMEDGLPKSTYEFVVKTLASEFEGRVLYNRHFRSLANAYYKLGDGTMARKVIQRMIDQTKSLGEDPVEYEQLIAMYKNN